MTVPAPDGVVRVPILRVSPTMGALTVDDKGRPVDWAVASEVREEWGHLRVFCGGEDVTFLRDVPTEIRNYEYQEPFEYGPAEIAFPQITPFDTLGDPDFPDLEWLVQGVNVEIYREDPDTGDLDEDPIWEGFASTWDPEYDEKRGYVFVLKCAGALAQAQLEPMPPSFEGGLVDAGAALKEAFDGVPSRRYATFPTVVTTRGTRNRGSWQSRYDYAQEILSTLYNADGTRQWTVGCDPGRVPTLHQKDMTTVHCHLAVGTQGAVLNETSDVTSSVGVIFAEGIAEDGGRWRNSRYPDSNPPVFVPLAYVSDNMPYTYDGEGNPTANPSFDPDRLRVARYENMGAGISKSEGVESALAELGRDVNPGWYGEWVLNIDPEEMSRRDLRAGMNIAARHHHGHPTRLFHIARVKVNHQTGAVAITVDTNARDWITLDGLRKRDREAATDPARRLNPPRRRSRMTPDNTIVFDAENGAGLVPSTALDGGAWNVIRIPASRYGTIVRTIMTTVSVETKFAVGIFSKSITASAVLALVGNPITGSAWDTSEAVADDLSDVGLQMAWGDSTELAGYWPLAGDGTNPITGRLQDDGSWDFVSDEPPYLWLAIYPADDCTLTGRLYLAPEQ